MSRNILLDHEGNELADHNGEILESEYIILNDLNVNYSVLNSSFINFTICILDSSGIKYLSASSMVSVTQIVDGYKYIQLRNILLDHEDNELADHNGEALEAEYTVIYDLNVNYSVLNSTTIGYVINRLDGVNIKHYSVSSDVTITEHVEGVSGDQLVNNDILLTDVVIRNTNYMRPVSNTVTLTDTATYLAEYSRPTSSNVTLASVTGLNIDITKPMGNTTTVSSVATRRAIFYRSASSSITLTTSVVKRKIHSVTVIQSVSTTGVIDNPVWVSASNSLTVDDVLVVSNSKDLSSTVTLGHIVGIRKRLTMRVSSSITVTSRVIKYPGTDLDLIHYTPYNVLGAGLPALTRNV